VPRNLYGSRGHLRVRRYLGFVHHSFFESTKLSSYYTGSVAARKQDLRIKATQYIFVEQTFIIKNNNKKYIKFIYFIYYKSNICTLQNANISALAGPSTLAV